MRRLIDPIELKRSIVVSNIIGDGKTLEELIDEQPDAQLTQTNAESTQKWQKDFREYIEQIAAHGWMEVTQNEFI